MSASAASLSCLGMLDKGRATLVKKNGESIYNSSTDQHLVRFLGFDPDALLKELGAGKGDGEILGWVQAHSKIRERRGRSKPGPLTWRSGGPTAMVRLSPGLPNTSDNTAKRAKTSKPGSKPLNSMTTPALEEKRKFRVHKNNAEQKTKKEQNK